MVFIASLQVMEGDNKVVNIIEDWDVLAEYAGEKLGFYQLIEDGGKTEIRVQTGRVAYKKEFEFCNDKQLKEILDFCKRHGYIQVSENMRDDQFFK
jgi:hypothetical protein